MLAKETAYNQRLDRHGRPFGERVSLSRDTAKPLRKKITPGQVSSERQIRRPAHLKDPVENQVIIRVGSPGGPNITEHSLQHLLDLK